MNEERSEDLLKKYLAAESTLEEEDRLFSNENQPEGIEEWSAYVKWKKKKAPSPLKPSFWTAVQNRKKRRHQLLAGLSGIAASIILVLAFFINGSNNNDISYYEKEARLQEALSMFADEKPSKQSIIYEDDMIIIYTASVDPN